MRLVSMQTEGDVIETLWYWLDDELEVVSPIFQSEVAATRWHEEYTRD